PWKKTMTGSRLSWPTASRRPDVEEQAVLGIASRHAILRADGAKRGGAPQPVPARVRLRRSPAQRTDRRQRIGDAAIAVERTSRIGRGVDRQPADLARLRGGRPDASLRDSR